jgi:fructose-bisphosphate aldolase / 2-amino-3,7-dideoxy-D-threo-hept-6-ulosonate synthase
MIRMSGWIGKKIRMERIIDRKTKRSLIIPMDHGLTVGPIDGLDDMGKMVDLVAEGGANAVIGHVGLPLYGHRGYGKDIGLILHISGSTALSVQKNYKVEVNTVVEAIKIGADAVSIHVNIGGADDSHMLETMGRVARECREWGMPLIAMMYPRGENITNENDVNVVKVVARIGAELGADFVKTNYTGDPDSFKEVVRGCPAPVIIAGGSHVSTMELLQMTKDAIGAGAMGVAYGRNVFSSKYPTNITRALALIIHQDFEIDEAIRAAKLNID